MNDPCWLRGKGVGVTKVSGVETRCGRQRIPVQGLAENGEPLSGTLALSGACESRGEPGGRRPRTR